MMRKRPHIPNLPGAFDPTPVPDPNLPEESSEQPEPDDASE